MIMMMMMMMMMIMKMIMIIINELNWLDISNNYDQISMSY